jgi:hypothetical protein
MKRGQQMKKGWRKWFQSRRGFIVMFSIGIMIFTLSMSYLAQNVALQDVEMAGRTLVKTRSWLNARSGLEAALQRMESGELDFEPFSERTGVTVKNGGYRVEGSGDVAEAFDYLAARIPGQKIYHLKSTGWSDKRRSRYETTITAVVRMNEGNIEILVWNETSS